MPDPSQTAQILEQLLTQIEEQTELLRERLSDQVRSTVSALEMSLAEKEQVPGTAPTDILYAKVATIYDAASQADILKCLLDGAAHFSARAALFVVKAGKLSLWQGRGFENESALKGLTLDANTGLAGRAVQDRTSASAAAADFDSEFVSVHGNPADGNATVSPLIVRDKVAALLYTDCGTTPDTASDPSAVQVLVRTASAWLEICALRKAGVSPAEAEPGVRQAAAAATAVEAAPEPAAPPAPSPKPEAPVQAPSTGLSPEDEALHKKAQRFARLLVDEIKLYNQAKVAEGREKGDLYQRLREDIDKSRATYEKRYSATSVAQARYFDQELVRILADNNPALLGSGFPE